MLRVAFLGAGGPVSGRSLEAVARYHRVVAVVEPDAMRRGLGNPLARLRHAARRVLRGPSELARAAASHGARHARAASRDDRGLVELLRTLAPDVMCIAAYPWVLPPSVYAIPRLGAINLHSSLLPRHRGPAPLFWVYHEDDRQAGVTVHWVSEQADAGDVLVQKAFELGRGSPLTQVHARCADEGARALIGSLAAIESGAAPRIRQDERLATAAPVIKPGSPFVRFADWQVERAWHVMAGLCPHYRQPLTDSRGAPFHYDAVLGFDDQAHNQPPGTVVRQDGLGLLYCRGGVVRLRAQAPSR